MDAPPKEVKLNFKVGDYVNTVINGTGFVVDILRSSTSSMVVVCVEFTYNFPNPRGFDMIKLHPDKMDLASNWTPSTKDVFMKELAGKKEKLIEKINIREAK